MNIVPRVPTPATEVALALALADGYTNAFGHTPRASAVACAWAMAALEHRRGAAIYCNNVGNITAFDWQGDVYELAAKERLLDAHGNESWVLRTLRYRALPSLAAGCQGYWLTLQAHYAAAIVSFDRGLPEVAAQQLADMRYYTGRADAYRAAMRSLYGEFFRTLAPALPPDLVERSAPAAPDAAATTARAAPACGDRPISGADGGDAMTIAKSSWSTMTRLEAQSGQMPAVAWEPEADTKPDVLA